MSAALREQPAHDQRMRAAEEFFEWYEAEYGEITEEEMEEAERSMRARAIRVNFPDDDSSTASGEQRSA